MTCPFERLGVSKRPGLDPAALKCRYFTASKSLHPDVEGGNAEEFAEMTRCYARLADPALRLEALLDKSHEFSRTGEVSDLFMKVGPVVHEADAVLGELPPTSVLAKAVFANRISRSHANLAAALAVLEDFLLDCEKRLDALDARWPDCQPEHIASLASDFRFVQKWIKEVKERLFRSRQALCLMDDAYGG